MLCSCISKAEKFEVVPKDAIYCYAYYLVASWTSGNYVLKSHTKPGKESCMCNALLFQSSTSTSCVCHVFNTRAGKHGKIIQTMMEYHHCTCVLPGTPLNGVGQTKVKTLQKGFTVNSNTVVLSTWKINKMRLVRMVEKPKGEQNNTAQRFYRRHKKNILKTIQ